MQRVCQKLGFSLHSTPDVVETRISLLEPAQEPGT